MKRSVEDMEQACDDLFDTRSMDSSQRSSFPAANDDAHGTLMKPKAHDKLVRGARLTVIMVLLLSAVAIATLAYVLLSKSEDDSFQTQFTSSARQVFLMANRNAVSVFISFSTMASMYPSNAEKSNETLPFVTIRGFDSIATGFRNVSKASYIHYKPLLHNRAELEKWNNYTAANMQWLASGRKRVNYGNEEVSEKMVPFVYTVVNGTQAIPVPGDGPFTPAWQISPVPAKLNIINWDAWTFEVSRASMEYVLKTGKPSLTEPIESIRLFFSFPVDGPISPLYQPVFDTTDDEVERKVVGYLSGYLPWKYFFDNVLPDGQNNTLVVVQSCSTNSTFLINGPEATFLGKGDLHNTKYSHMRQTRSFIDNENEESNSSVPVQCKHLVHVYPTAELESSFKTSTPKNNAIIIVSIFTFAALVFFLYDFFVTSRQNRTEKSATKSNAIVQELFPGDMAERLFESTETAAVEGRASTLGKSGFGKVDRTTIAELHPEATVLFADISGFTAWSSIRDPHQVFTLLETVFQSFDAIAKRHGVFKVETIGDCYVAACGVPKVNDLHAVVMCRFARRVMLKFRSVCRILELTLGPDTGDLALRVGMHSGPVTAGVLRGERARFQLFGDTVNTASRIESTGQRERVHLSEQTAAQLIKHGKEDWIVRRDDMIEAKGKGKLVTFWLKLSANERAAGSVIAGSEVGDEDKGNLDHGRSMEVNDWNVDMPLTKPNEARSHNDRLAEWNSEILTELLQRVVSHRAALSVVRETSPARLTALARDIGKGHLVVDEVVEIIDMPDFVCATTITDVELDETVVEQLRAFVTQISMMYNDNPFHNFEHASHVTMSINKLLCRIVAPKIDLDQCSDADQQAAILHDHTCGITSDPLTQFAVVLSGLIHDLDHPGVANGQLIQEDPQLAQRYHNKSVAEQNSVDLAWSVLISSDYNELRAAIFATETELRRFRHLLVNAVIATDIFDKDQGTIRKNRWNKAFYETDPHDASCKVKSRKATIVIEHLIQASDVAHTMQHWHVYQKWNQCLFDEMMMAFRNGRSDKSPVDGWYSGELWFFDNYVIPLAKKLKDCGVFGVSSDEYLNYAVQNRDEWESKGQEIVQQYVGEYERKQEAKSCTPSFRLVL